MNTEQIKADFYQGLNMVRDKIQRHKTALLLMINSFEKAIELKAQEPSAVSAEEVFNKIVTDDLFACSRVWEAWDVGTMTKEDFIPLNECEEFKEDFIKSMQEYANASMREETFKYFFECGRNYQNNAEVTFKVAYEEYLNTLTTK